MSNERFSRPLPDALSELRELALDLRATASHFAASIWDRLDSEAWERTRNPHMILMNAHEARLEEAAQDREFLEGLSTWLERRRRYYEAEGWFGRTHGDAGLRGVAYFSMEFGLSEGLPIHSGGLGILAGDHLKSASDLGVPVIGVGLLYQQGYFRQVLSHEGKQLEALPYNDPGIMPVTPVTGPDGRWPRVRLELPGRTLFLRVWQARVGRVTLYLLDSNDPLNTPWDRGVTSTLYASDPELRLLQEIALGVGGWRLLEKLGIDVDVCHLNEGHAAFAVVARAASFAKEHGVSFEAGLAATRAGNVFTTHTPVEAAFDVFDAGQVATFAGPLLAARNVEFDQVLPLGRENPDDASEGFNMAYLAMRGSSRVNGVSRLHGAVSRGIFAPLFPGVPVPEVPVGHVTNGVHVPTWDTPESDELWTKALPDGHWPDSLEEAAEGVANLADADIWEFRAKARQSLVAYARRRLSRQMRERGAPDHLVERGKRALDPNALTLGFARRFATYKRPTLMLRDAERLARLLTDRERPVQLVVAGKAHPNDGAGKQLVEAIAMFAKREDVWDSVVLLEDYDTVLGQHLAGGVDVWLNNPRRPLEACGTSGMKMLVNGGLNFSVLDGWWDEAWSPDVGWEIGGGIDNKDGARDAEEAEELYARLEDDIVPTFFERDADGVPRRWVALVKSSMSRLTPRFSSNRMVTDYVEQAYLPAAAAWAKRSADGGRAATEFLEWRRELDAVWRRLRFVSVDVLEEGDERVVTAQVHLDELTPDSVRVELYAEPLDHTQPPEIHRMERERDLAGTWHGYRYTVRIPAARPAEHYTPRIVPHHPAAILPIEAPRMLWA